MHYTRRLVFLILLVSPFLLSAQNVVTGKVTDKTYNEPLLGASIVVKGTTNGTTTDFDGNYQISAETGDILIFSYIGFSPMEVTVTGTVLNVQLDEDTNQLDEIVVIGYGTTTVKDATGSVDLVTAEDFNKGAIVSTDQLLNGKAAGVRITSDGGSPDAAPNIRIRGGSSLSASSAPLIVIDGIPIGADNPAGVSNPLTLVNPNDIESFSILKDASATAIYGARASNGVLIITTKKGTSGDVKFNFSSDTSVSTAPSGLNVMDGNDFTRFVQEFYPNSTGLLGVPLGTVETTEAVAQIISTPDGDRAIYNTDWRDAILRTAITSNVNFSARANLFRKVPFRASLGYTNAHGIVLTDDYERYSGSLSASPNFLDDDLKVDVNAKMIYAEKNAIDTDGALGNALSFNPTQPVFNSAASNPFGGFYQNIIDASSENNPDRRIVAGSLNPLALLQQRTRPEQVFRFLGNIKLDYSLPFVEGLKVVANFGLDASRSDIEEVFSDNNVVTVSQRESLDGANFIFNPGVNYRENQDFTNTTFDFYTQYNKNFESGIVNKFDIQGGYSYQNFKNEGTKDEFRYNPETGLREVNPDPQNPTNRYFNEWNIQSFFARSNISLAEKYLFTFSVRADGTSLFVQDDVWDSDVWGIFPAAAFAWQVKEEGFLKDVAFINDLKLRLGWGQTGQADITDVENVGFYPSTPLFDIGSGTSQYFPNSSIYSALQFNPDLTWETTTTYNIGLDFGIGNDLLSGAFDVYYRKTEDLLASVNLPPGQGLINVYVDNVGSTESRGFELNLNANPIRSGNFNLSINGNLSYNLTELTDLEGQEFLEDGESNVSGTGTSLRYSFIGGQINEALVFKQIYDTNGDPIPGAVVDRNGDNVIDFDDRYLAQIVPNWTFGFGLNFTYKQWDFSSAFRGQIGGNVFNINKLNRGFIESALPQNAQTLNNVLNFYEGAANLIFQDYTAGNSVILSDYFLEDASFLRCDNMALGYTFGSNFIKNVTLRLYGAVTNPFIITDYSGQDPENFGGIDGNFYPRPRTYTMGITIDF